MLFLTRQKSALLIGGAGVKNFGDELMVRLWLEYYAARRLPVVCQASAPGLMRTLFRQFPAAKFRRLRPELPDAVCANFWLAFRAGLNATPSELRAFGPRVAIVHLHGGGYLNTLWPSHGYRLGFAVAAKRLFGCPLVATGIGMQPLPPPPADMLDEVRDAFAAFDLFETRDHPSFELAAQFTDRAIDGLDDTFLQPIAPAATGPHTLHLSCFRNARDLARALVDAPAALYGSFDRVLFWQCSPGDTEIFDLVAAAHPSVALLDFSDAILDALPVSPGDMMITARFHPHLLAARHSATGLFRDDDGYYDVKHGSLVRLGSGFRPVDLNQPLQAQLLALSGAPDIVRDQSALLARKAGITSAIDSLLGAHV